ncbi:hypothetical protein PMAYCL1PPCAC_08999, partial [Pristionchus mayeri]
LFSIGLLLLVSSTAQVTADLKDGDPGVCHFIKKISEIVYEEHEVEHTSTEWCWDITKGFHCEVVYTTTETVPVTKEHEVDTLECCDGWIQVGDFCVEHEQPPGDAEEPEYEGATADTEEESDTVKLRANRVEMDTVAPPEQGITDADGNRPMDDLEVDNTLFREPSSTLPPVIVDPLNEDHHSDDDHVSDAMDNDALGPFARELMKSLAKDTTTVAPEEQLDIETLGPLAKELFKHLAKDSTIPAPGVVTEIGHNGEPLDDEVLGPLSKELFKHLAKGTTSSPSDTITETIDDADPLGDVLGPIARELLKSLMKKPSTPAPDATTTETTTSITVPVADSEEAPRNGQTEVGTFAQELLDSLGHSTEAPAPSSSDSESSVNGANAEATAVEALGIFVHEILKSLDHHSPTPPPAAEVYAEDIAGAAEALSIAQAVLLQTIAEINETLLRSLSRVHQALSLLLPIAPLPLGLE